MRTPNNIAVHERALLFEDGFCLVCEHPMGDHRRLDKMIWTCRDEDCQNREDYYCRVPKSRKDKPPRLGPSLRSTRLVNRVVDDRRIHAFHPDGTEVVRYDYIGKWYIETPREKKRVSLTTAAEAALRPGMILRYGVLGGEYFDRKVHQLLRRKSNLDPSTPVHDRSESPSDDGVSAVQMQEVSEAETETD